MIDAFSSRAAGTNSAYRATDAEAAKQPTAQNAAPSASAESPAVIISLSDDALAQLNGAAAKGETRLQVAALDAKIAHLDRQDALRAENANALAGVQGAYEKLRDTPIKPAVTLNAEDTTAAFQMLKEAGKTLPAGGWDSYGFVKDGVQYNFKRDGSVTVQEEGVATSAEQQAGILKSMSNMMSFISARSGDSSDQLQSLREQRASLLAE
jgi:hypothetical protein